MTPITLCDGRVISTAQEAFADANSLQNRRAVYRRIKYDPDSYKWEAEWKDRFLALQIVHESVYKWCDWYPGPDEAYWPANKDWLPGRIIMPCEPDHDPTIEEWDWVADAVGPNDIVWIPLYHGSLNGPTPSTWPQQKLPDYGKFVALIEELAPRVKGILLGNNGCELCFRVARRGEDENGEVQWSMDLPMSIHLACAFVEETAPLVLRAGGRPFYGTMDWMIIYDCYNPLLSGRLRQIVNAVNGVHICLCAATLLPDGNYDRNNPLLARGQEQVIRGQEGDDPKHLRAYLDGGIFWGDVEGAENITLNGTRLKDLGFKELTV